MSYADGHAALRLEMPGRVPRTEYSIEMHYPFIERITGIKLEHDSPQELRREGVTRMYKEIGFDFSWSVLIGADEFGDKRTKMGHAVYQKDGVDYAPEIKLLYDDPEDALRFDPYELYGTKDEGALTERFNRHYDNNTAFYNDLVNMTGIYVTCMSGLIEIFGWDTLLTAGGIDPEGFGAVAERYAGWISQYFRALANSKAPVVMVHDDIVWTSGAFFHPEWYRKYIFRNYKKLFAPLIEAKKIIVYTSDGSYTEFIDDIAECGVNCFVLEPTTDMACIAEKYGRTHAFIGNADTRVLLTGSKEDIYSEVKRCMDIGKSCPGFFMAVGNHIPPNTPVDNVLYYNEVYDRMSRR